MHEWRSRVPHEASTSRNHGCSEPVGGTHVQWPRESVEDWHSLALQVSVSGSHGYSKRPLRILVPRDRIYCLDTHRILQRVSMLGEK